MVDNYFVFAMGYREPQQTKQARRKGTNLRFQPRQVVAARARKRPAYALVRFGAAVFAAAQRRLVELSGIEPLTSSLRTRRSPN